MLQRIHLWAFVREERTGQRERGLLPGPFIPKMGKSENQIPGWNPGGKFQDKESKYLWDVKTHKGHDF